MRAANVSRAPSPAALQALLDLVADLDEDADQMGDVAAGVVDVRLEQYGVARGLVDLDIEATRQQAFELRSVETGGSANQRHAGRVEVELILAHRLDYIGPAGAGLQIVDEARLPESIGN